MPRASPFAIFWLVATLSAAVAAQQPSLEYDVKAAFVLNFVRYVEWPPERRTPPLCICVLQPDPFGKRLEAVITGEQWQGAPITVRAVTDLRSSVDCHLLYVPEATGPQFSKSVSAVSGLPILTVGEHEEFLEQGGMVRLFVEANRIRFSINQRGAEAVGLLVSSRLLRLARTVIGMPNTR
jgi:YfiR/HmsC-like